MLDNIGNWSFSGCRRVLNHDAVYVASFGRPDHRWLGPAAQLLKMGMEKPFVSQRAVTWVAKPSRADLLILQELVETGRVSPVVDRTYPLDQVADAMRHPEGGHARGKIVITI